MLAPLNYIKCRKLSFKKLIFICIAINFISAFISKKAVQNQLEKSRKIYWCSLGSLLIVIWTTMAIMLFVPIICLVNTILFCQCQEMGFFPMQFIRQRTVTTTTTQTTPHQFPFDTPCPLYNESFPNVREGFNRIVGGSFVEWVRNIYIKQDVPNIFKYFHYYFGTPLTRENG